MLLYQAKNILTNILSFKTLLYELMQSNYVLKPSDTVLLLFSVAIPFANNTFILFLTLTLVMLNLQSFYLSFSSFKMCFKFNLLCSLSTHRYIPPQYLKCYDVA